MIGDNIGALEDIRPGMKLSTVMIDNKETFFKVKVATAENINISGVVYKN